MNLAQNSINTPFQWRYKNTSPSLPISWNCISIMFIFNDEDKHHFTRSNNTHWQCSLFDFHWSLWWLLFLMMRFDESTIQLYEGENTPLRTRRFIRAYSGACAKQFGSFPDRPAFTPTIGKRVEDHVSLKMLVNQILRIF